MQHWKCCVGQPTVGSNPTPSAIFGVSMSEKNKTEDKETDTKLTEKEDKKIKKIYLPFTKELQDSILFSLKELTIKMLELENRIIALEEKNE